VRRTPIIKFTIVLRRQGMIHDVIFRKEQGGVGTFGRILVKKTVHGFQGAHRFIESDIALAAQVRLQIGHQKSSSNSLPCNIGNNYPEPVFT
jgi:hypothetical protein